MRVREWKKGYKEKNWWQKKIGQFVGQKNFWLTAGQKNFLGSKTEGQFFFTLNWVFQKPIFLKKKKTREKHARKNESF